MSAKTETPTSTHKPTSPVHTSDIVLPVLFTRMAGRHDHHPRLLESERAV